MATLDSDHTDQEHAGPVAERLAAIVTSSEDAIISKSLDGTIASWNPAAERMYGYAAADIIGRPSYVLIPPELHEQEREMLQRVGRGERVDQYETIRLREDGTEIHVALTLSPIRDRAGTIVGASAIARDTTMQRADEALRQTAPIESAQEQLERLVAAGTLLISEPSLERVLQQTAAIAAEVIGARYAAIGVLAPDGRLLESFTTHGITPEERALIGPPPKGHGILGLVIREARVIRLPDLARHPDSYGFPPHHPPMHSFLGAPVVGRRGVFGDLYLTEKLGGGHFTEEDEHIVKLLAAQIAAAVENAQLHEESARLLEEVQQLHRSRERFFAMVNHELRNALAATFGWAEMLVRKKDPATVPPAAFEVLESAEQAISLINDLLDLSRLDEERLRPVLRAVDPAAVVRRAVGRVMPAANAKQATITVDLPKQPPICHTDASRVEQILVNLLGNAIRHAPDATEIRLSATLADSKIVITIEDQGSGIAPDDVEQIFDVYVTKAAEEGRGVGLGLPLSRRLARLLGGDLRAVAQPGRGGCVVLELPAPSE